MFKPDQPIKSYKEDTLGRRPFAQSLGDAILRYREKGSIVIGLFGAWGCGKTSIINMALEHIDLASKNKTDDEKPIVIRFNPWNYSDQNQLITQFFKQLSVTLRRPDYAGEVKEAGERLETYAKFFEPLALIPTVGPFASLFSKVVKNLGGAAKSWSDLKSNDLNAIRKELNELLDKQPHKIIVVIDDIDRLNNTEIRQIFQLIKSLGDFPNTIYFLAFDKNVVINALKQVQEGSGIAYLEKVVQIPFEVPLISKEAVADLLFGQLNELVKDISEDKWDRTYWGNIYHSGLKFFFENIRDVTRYINSLRFSFEMVKEEVNVIDFLAITGIQVFIPEVYYGIRDNKDLFAGIFDMPETQVEQAKKRCDEIISRNDKLPKETLVDFLKRLFPKLGAFYGNGSYGDSYLEKWRKEGQICSPDIFDIFFRLSVPRGEIRRKEIETILSLGNNPDLFAEALLKLNEDRKIIRFLERLEDYTGNDIPKENIEPIITVMMDIGDMFPPGEFGLTEIDTPMKILRIIYQLSHRFDSHERRFNILKRAIKKATRSLFTIVCEVSTQDQQHGEYRSKKTLEPEEKRTVNSEQLEELERLACNKIEKWAKDGRLAKHRRLHSILFRWKEWGQEDKVNGFVNDVIKSDDGLIDFITSFSSKYISKEASDYVGTTHWRIHLKDVKKFVDLKEVEPRIRKIASSSNFKNLDDQKKPAIKTFLDTIDGRIKEPF